MFSDANLQVLGLFVLVSLFVYAIVWLEDNQKSKVLPGYYVVYAGMVAFNGAYIGVFSFVFQFIIFKDYEISIWGRLTIALTLSLMSTQSPHYKAITSTFPTTDGKEGS